MECRAKTCLRINEQCRYYNQTRVNQGEEYSVQWAVDAFRLAPSRFTNTMQYTPLLESERSQYEFRESISNYSRTNLSAVFMFIFNVGLTWTAGW